MTNLFIWYDSSMDYEHVFDADMNYITSWDCTYAYWDGIRFDGLMEHLQFRMTYLGDKEITEEMKTQAYKAIGVEEEEEE